MRKLDAKKLLEFAEKLLENEEKKFGRTGHIDIVPIITKAILEWEQRLDEDPTFCQLRGEKDVNS